MQNYNLKFKNKMILEKAIDFHGHLGPYLVLGMLMANLAIKELKCKKHFGVEAVIRGALDKPKSCLIDGIQVSAGCTYGKGNIRKLGGDKIKVLFRNLQNNKGIKIYLKKDLIEKLNNLDGYKESKTFARALLKIDPVELFELKF